MRALGGRTAGAASQAGQPCSSAASSLPLAPRRIGSAHGHLDNAVASSRQSSHLFASTSGSRPANGVCRRGRVAARALLAPPQFKFEKLSMTYGPGSSPSGPAPPAPRRYTLTHNDLTGTLQLTIGADYNYDQISGLYTRLLRDEVTAEWRCSSEDGDTSLHVFCHVSGEARWLAPPFLRDYIFRREMQLVLDTLRWADRQLLHQRPDLAAASVYVHFQSDLQQLDIVESWGVLNDPATWRNVPSLISWSLAVLSGNSQAQQQAMQAAKPAAEAAAVLPAPAAADMPGGPHEGAIDSSNGNGSSAIAAPCACCSEDSSQSGANGTSIKDSSWPAPSLGSQQPAAAAAAVPVTVGRQSSTTKVGVM